MAEICHHSDEPDFIMDSCAYVESKRCSEPSFSNEYTYMDCINDTTCEFPYFPLRKSLSLLLNSYYMKRK